MAYYGIPLVSFMFSSHLGDVHLAGTTLGNSWATVAGSHWWQRSCGPIYHPSCSLVLLAAVTQSSIVLPLAAARRLDQEKKTCRTELSSVINTICFTIEESDEVCKGFRKSNRAHQYVDELIKNSRFPPAESFDALWGTPSQFCVNISGTRNKALFLGYKVKWLLMAYTEKRKCDNKEDFRNKRELRADIRHAKRQMLKAIQRNLNSDHDLKELERYLDASIVTNGLNPAFSLVLGAIPAKEMNDAQELLQL
ncbi:hypothetical protein EJB05_28464, partial [Eragrostis curvula]